MLKRNRGLQRLWNIIGTMRTGRSNRLLKGAGLGLLLVVAAMLGSAQGAGHGQPGQQDSLWALQRLQSDFHGATALEDYDLLYSVWADDAVFSGGGVTKVGPKAITDFLSSGPNWGKAVGLTPASKMTFDIQGNTAYIRFECIYVYVGDNDPLTTSLASIPPGSQNPAVEIVQHSNATCTCVRQRGRWVIQTFNGSAGAIK